MSWSSLPHLVAAGALLAALATASPEGSKPAADPGRPVVLVLHGRGVSGVDSASLRRDWRDALNLGLVAAGSESFVGVDDLRLVWYADALDPREAGRCAAGPDGAPASELASGLAAAGELLGIAAEWMGDAEGAALRSLAGDLIYLGDDQKRCGAESRLVDALQRATREDRPIVLVAHSFGSLVSYHHLRVRDSTAAPRVERYVTIGSLLGRAELRRLLLGPEGSDPVLPAGVGSWVNVRDPADPLASALVGLGEAGRSGRIQDVKTERGLPGDPHEAARYLADPATARAVLVGWCAALPAGGSGERACRAAGSAPSPQDVPSAETGDGR